MPAPDLPTDPDELAAVTSTAQFGAALQRLRKAAGWSLRELQKRTEREVERQPKSGHVVLAKSTVADVEGGKVLPRLEWLTCYLTVCRLPTREQRPWLRTRARLVVGPALVTTSPLRWQHVADCDPHALGVHPSITTAPAVGHPDRAMVPLSPLSPLPQWVPRDVEDQVRDAVVTAAGQAGLVVLVGGSSTGKTRLAYQALREEVGDWRLYQPADTAELTAAVASGQLPRGGWVVWLDELQHYLADGLSLGTLRALLDPERPMVLLATLWPSWYEHFTAPPPPPPAEPTTTAPGHRNDPVRDSRLILTTLPLPGAIIRLGDFSEAERGRAQQRAERDPRWTLALGDSRFGPTQVLAGAPQLVDRWEHASDPFAKAVLTAAIDAHRLGHLDPLTAGLLEAAAAGYLNDQQRATADPSTWFAKALAYATTPLHGATAALLPVAGPGIGTVAGYTVADYLLQHAQAARRWTRPPGSLWESLAAHAALSDRVRLAVKAQGRWLFRHAMRIAAPAAEAGEPDAMVDLARQLKVAGYPKEAEEWHWRAAETGKPGAMWALVEELEATGRADEAEEMWRQAAGAGNSAAMLGLAHHLQETALSGDRARLQEAEQWYRRAAEAGEPAAMVELAEELDWAGRLAEAEEWYRRAAEAGNTAAMRGVARQLEKEELAERTEQKRQAWDLWRARWAEQVEQVWRRAAEAGDPFATGELPEPETRRPGGRPGLREDGLWQAGEPGALRELARRLERAGRVEQAEEWYRRAAEAGNPGAMSRLARLLEGSGRAQQAEEWYRRAIEAGNPDTPRVLARLLEGSGRAEEARRLRRFGLEPDGRTADPWHPPTPQSRQSDGR